MNEIWRPQRPEQKQSYKIRKNGVPLIGGTLDNVENSKNKTDIKTKEGNAKSGLTK